MILLHNALFIGKLHLGSRFRWPLESFALVCILPYRIAWNVSGMATTMAKLTLRHVFYYNLDSYFTKDDTDYEVGVLGK